ncbi:MAG TPA: hypothetical protein VJT75_13380 [Thermoleophilaceae bacterium]|nr:hypothetical protein [Thermoleophilaceae bacterium]
MPRRLRPVVAVLACLLAAPAAASAVDAQFTRSDLRAYAESMAAPWPQIQKDNGTFPDYTDTAPDDEPDTRYGDAFMGYALVRFGLRTGNQAYVDSGVRATVYSIKRWNSDRKKITQSVFENWAVPATYNLIKKNDPDNEVFRKNRKRWEDWLRISRAERSGITFEYGNHWLVDAAGVFETLDTGLSSSKRDAILGGERGAAQAGALSLVNYRVPGLAPSNHKPFMFNDPPDNPMAYQGLSLGIYAHLIRTLGKQANGRAKDLLRKATDALWYDTAPDGDNGYFGRSQEILWGSAGTAYGAMVAANLSGTSDEDAARYRALADRALQRLRDAYPIGDRGQFFVPGLAQDIWRTFPALDGYAGAPSMDGIALVLIDYLIDEMKKDREYSRLAADRNLSRGIGSGYGRIAMVREDDVWFALRLKPTAHRHHVGDLRYDGGLAIGKHRDDEGRWTDVVPVRPTTDAPGFDSAGPAILSGSRIAGIPVGDSLDTSKGNVRVKGSIRSRSDDAMAPYRANYKATDCGAEVLFAAYPGHTYEYSAFFRGGDLPKSFNGGKRLSDGKQTVRYSPRPDDIGLQRGYESSVDPRLVRARTMFRVSKARTVHIEMC